MALRNWWHLSNNANDYGLDRVNGVISNVTFDGYSTLFDNDNDHIQVDYENLFIEDYNSEYTMACWVYLNSTATNHSSSLFSRGDWNSGSEQTCFALYDFNNGYGKILVPNKSGWNNGISLSNKIQLKQWYHIAITYNGTKTIGYVNGVYVGEYAGGGFPSSTGIHYAYIGAATYYSGFTLKGKIRDFRLYDHCLSKKEVKELSKGLILHYDFEDEEIEKTTNMVTSAYYSSGNQTWGGHTSVTENVAFSDAPISRGSHITVTYSGSDGGGLSRSISHNILAPNTQYTYSMYIKSSDNLAYTHANFMYRYEYNSGGTKLYEGGLYNASRRIYCGNGWHRIWGTFTTNANTASTTLYFFAYPNKNVEYWIGGCQVEAKDHMTPYVLGSRSDSKVYDNSGYGYDGNIAGVCEIISNSKSGNKSIKLSGGGDITTSMPILDTLINSAMTISFWIYPITSISPGNESYLTLGQTTDENVAFNLENTRWFCYNAANSPTVISKSISLNTWYHIAYVFNNKVITRYINGSLTSGDTATLASFKPIDTLAIGKRLGSNKRASCYYSDMKIFATALSEADVKAEYNRKAAIDRDGNTFVSHIKEWNLPNIVDTARWGIGTRTWNSCYGTGTVGSNISISLTNNGIKIYRTPNHDGLAQSGHGWDNWGGIKLTPLLEDSNSLQKGHTYLVKLHVKGKTCNSFWFGVTNQMGWGGGGLSPSPSNVSSSGIPSDFDGEKDCWYKFTINDDVYKTCTSSYSGFTQGNVYPSYRDITFNTEYSVTNEVGTELYITNPRMYDITGMAEQEIQILKTGILNCEDIYECPDANARFEKSKTVSVVGIYEN